MKQGWQTYTLGQVCDIARGGSPRPIKSFLTDDPNGIRWIKIGDTEVGGKYISSTKERIIKEGIKSSRYVKAGDFLLSNSMSFGRPYILKVDGCIHDGWLVIRDYEETFIQDFLYYLLLSPSVAKQFEDGARGSTVRNLNTDIVSAVKVNVPTKKSEQQRIVNLLDAEFAKIDTLKANAERNLQNANDLFQAALKKELEPKDGWGKYRTDEVCVVSPSKSEVKKKNLKDVDWVSFLPMEDMTIGIKNVCPLQVKPFGEVSGSYTYFEDNDVLLAKVTPCFENGKLGITRNLKNGVGYGSSEFIVFRANSELVQPDYLYYCMQEPSFLKEGKKRMIGACGLKRLPKDFVKTRPLGIPSLTKQQSIVARLDVLNEKCKTLQANYEKTLSLCDDLKQALLRKAFNGEI